MTGQELNECIAEVKYSDMPEPAKKKIMNVLYEQMHKNGWIPCSERMPGKDGVYLATLDGEIVGEDKPFSGVAEFESGKWIDDEEDYQCIFAWQTLPEPYQDEERKEAD